MNTHDAILLALQHYRSGNLQQAEVMCERILKKQPGDVNILHLLGIINYQRGNYNKAIKYIKKVLQFNPNDAEAYYNLGNALRNKGLLDEAISCYQKALQFNPIGAVFHSKGKLDEAISSYQKAIEINPDFADSYNNLGSALKDRGQLNEAEIYFRHALQIKPDYSIAYSNLLFDMNYNSRYNPQTIFSEHLLFAKKFEEPLCHAISPHTNERQLTRRLRIGYVSPDFRRHSVTYFIEPVIVLHNRKDFEIFCYTTVSFHDEVTDRIQKFTDEWRSIEGISDEKATEIIRRDGIDILVDLAGHTGNNRILLFVRKPAPVQVSWIGYPATTGLSTIDYKIVDNYTDPLGMTEQFYTEELIRLPDSFLCYLPDKDSPEVCNLPALTSDYITFGSFNNFPKASPEVIVLWAKILKKIPDSRLIMKTKSFSDRVTCEYAMEQFRMEGIAGDRIELLPWKSSTRQHLDIYNHVDIGLDTFPYNGTTTTCEAMWMGVPVITLAGNTHATRVGVSLLSNIGLTELIANTHEEYVEIAVKLATDIERLQLLRKRLRDMMLNSPLTDANRFTVNLEKCYRMMWEMWCNKIL